MDYVCVYFADGFEEIEAVTIIDLLRRAEIKTYMVSVSENLSVTGAHGIEIKADMLFDYEFCKKAIAAVLPGGSKGVLTLKEKEELISIISEFIENNEKTVAAICAAPTILGELGLLKGKSITCYPGLDKPEWEAKVEHRAFSVDGNLLTSRGPGTAVPFALKLIDLIADERTMDKVKNSLAH